MRKPKSRGHGEGTIYPLKNGKGFKVAISVGRVRGKRVRVTENAETKADAVAKLSKLREKYRTKKYIAPTSQTVEEYLRKWLVDHVAAHYAESTHALWENTIENHILPAIGESKLAALRPEDVQRLVDEMAAEDDGPSRSHQVAFHALRKALKHAKKPLRLIEEDPSEDISRPGHEEKDIFPFDKAEADRIIAETAGTRSHVVVVMMIMLGMRQGEVFGLHKKAIDRKKETIRIRQAAAQTKGKVSLRTPKTKAGVREVHMPQIVIDALEAHQAIMLREGNAASDLVIPAPEGGLMQRTIFRSRYWLPVLDTLKIAPRGAHHMRHTYAALQLAAGTPINVVSKIMGHKKVSTTYDAYGHLMPGQQTAATDAMQRMFG